MEKFEQQIQHGKGGQNPGHAQELATMEVPGSWGQVGKTGVKVGRSYKDHLGNSYL